MAFDQCHGNKDNLVAVSFSSCAKFYLYTEYYELFYVEIRQDKDKTKTRQRQDKTKTRQRQDKDKTKTRQRQDKDKTKTRQRQDKDKTKTRQRQDKDNFITFAYTLMTDLAPQEAKLIEAGQEQ